jgi:hypothetical protein
MDRLSLLYGQVGPPSAHCSQKRRAAAPAAQFADEEEKGDKANEFVALKAPVFSSQTDLGIAG